MIRRTLPKRVLAILALLCLSVASVSAQVHIREKIQIQPTSPPIAQAEVNTSDNLRFVFEWTPERIVGRMLVTGLDNDFNVVVDTFLTDVGGHLEVISPAVEGEYTFNLQIRTAELLPGEQETLKLSIYLNETLVREDTDFSYSFCDVFCVWIPESFIFFADPLHHFSLQLAPNQPSYGEAAVLTVTARDAGNSEITLDGSKTLTLRVVSEDFFSFITASGDTIGPEMTGVPYNIGRSGAIRLIANGLIPDTLSVSGIVSAELEENTSKTGQLEFEADMPCVQTDLSSTTAQPSDTVAVSFSFTRTDGNPGLFRPDQQFSVFIAANDSMGLLYSSDGQIGPDLFGAIQPLYYVAPDSLSGDSLVVQFFVAPVSAGGAAAAAPVGHPTMGKRSAGARSSSNALQALALTECVVAQLVVRPDDLDHFLVTLEKDTVAFTETSKIFVQAKNAANENIALDPFTLLKFELAGESAFGTFIKPNGDTLKTIPVELSDIRYDDAKVGRVIFAAVAANPETSAKPLIRVSLQSDEARKGEEEIVVIEMTLKIVMDTPREVRPRLSDASGVLQLLPENRKRFAVRLTRGGILVGDHQFTLTTDYVDGSGGHDHVNRRTENRENYGYFVSMQNGREGRPLSEPTFSDVMPSYDLVGSQWGDSLRIKLSSDIFPKVLIDSVTVTERIIDMVLVPESAHYFKTGGTCEHHGPRIDALNPTCRTPDNNHYIAGGALADLDSVAVVFGRDRNNRTGLMKLNDLSLPFGGLFDIYGNWMGPHSSHRTGRDVDIENMNLNVLRRYMTRFRWRYILEDPGTFPHFRYTPQ